MLVLLAVFYTRCPIAPWAARPACGEGVNIFVDSGRVFVRDKLSSETTDEDISSAGAGVTLNIPKKENKYPGLSFALTYGVPMPGAKKPAENSGNPQSTFLGWGTIYLSGMTNY